MIGARFRLHGRNPASGLDCVGLVLASLAAIGRAVPDVQGYALRNASIDRLLERAMSSGLVPEEGAARAGTILLLASGPAQHHLAIAMDAHTIVHAHAGLRRVVRQPLAPRTQVLAQWRLAPHIEGM
jgi:cell wall-associated NlpC family hydrolase